VFGDTWWFNLYTREWAAGTVGAGAAPVASNLPVAAPEGVGAVAFGGRSGTGSVLGRLYTFDPAVGWTESEFPRSVLPATLVTHPSAQAKTVVGTREGYLGPMMRANV
jgi:hypothetical protein